MSILNAAESINGVVVGGQALNIWADVLLTPEDYELLGPFTSKDIDFWGTQTAAEELAQTLNGKVLLPPKWGSSPSEAAVVIDFGGESHQIDFLHNVCGLVTKELLKRAQEIEYNGLTVTILHPIDVLKSREAGVRVLRRTDPGAVRQLRASPIIATRFIELLLSQGDISAAQDGVREIIRIGLSTMTDQLYSDYGYDPLKCAAPLANRSEWHPKFAEHQIKRICRRGIDARDKRLKEAFRRSSHL